MGLRGPAPKPTALRIATDGNTERYKRKHEPEDIVAAPNAPAFLSDAASAHWRYIVPRLLGRRTLTEADLGLLAMMCTEYAEYESACVDLAALRESGRGYKGHMIDHPRARMRGAFERYSKAAIQFGLSPAAKCRVQAGKDEQSDGQGKSRFLKTG